MANPAYMSRLDVSGGLARPLPFLAGGFWAIEAVALLGALGMGSSPRNMRDTRTRKSAPEPSGRAPLGQWAALAECILWIWTLLTIPDYGGSVPHLARS